MRIIILFITLSWAGLAAQSISQVDYNVLPGNLIEVIYTLQDSEVNGLYDIEVHASLDGGYSFPVRAVSVTGDVGQVRGRGRKSMLWKVLDDLPALVSDNLVIKVVGRRRITVGGLFTSLVAGNRFTKRLSNGVTFYGGNGGLETQSHQAFARLLADDLLVAGGNYRAGLRITSIPIIYRIEGRYANWDLRLPVGETDALTYLAYGDSGYEGEELVLNYAGFAFGVSYTPLPVFGILLPQIGGGASYNLFTIGKIGTMQLSSMRNPSVYAEVAVQVNLLRWLKFNIGLRQDFLGPKVNFGGLFMEAGLHIPG